MIKGYYEEHASIQYSQAIDGNHMQANNRVLTEVIKYKNDGIGSVYKSYEIQHNIN